MTSVNLNGSLWMTVAADLPQEARHDCGMSQAVAPFLR
jgi:hypothetical protein